MGGLRRLRRRHCGAPIPTSHPLNAARAARARLAESDAIRDEAVETLARALVADGQPRGNPFDAFGAPAPGTLTRLSFAEEAHAVHQLVAAVQRSKTVSKATIQAAQAADKAARIVEQALAPVAKLQESVRDARRMRDAVAPGLGIGARRPEARDPRGRR